MPSVLSSNSGKSHFHANLQFLVVTKTEFLNEFINFKSTYCSLCILNVESSVIIFLTEEYISLLLLHMILAFTPLNEQTSTHYRIVTDLVTCLFLLLSQN